MQLFYDFCMQKTSMRKNNDNNNNDNNNDNNPFMMIKMMSTTMTMMSLPNRRTARRCGKAQFVFRILLSVFLYSGISNAFVSPSKRRTVVWRPPHETFCQYQQQEQQQQVQCWDLPKSSLSTRLYDGTGYETELITSSTDDSVGTTMETVNGASVNGAANGHEQPLDISISDLNNNSNSTEGEEPSSSSSQHTMMMMIDLEEEVPTPTHNGGYSHTTASKAKIAAANKGKTPWNKGRSHSEDVRARIAAGVRANNRERFLQKLQDDGLTEEEYEAQKAEERRSTDAEKLARRTEKGGYRPTNETRAKISMILKEKHAKGEIKRRSAVDPSKVRRGFTHSEETRAKISEALKKRWANDPEYREKMKTHVTRLNTKPETRKRISDTLKKKWKDPEFRAEMLEKMSHRDNSMQHGEDHRRKISEAMKAKWQDKEYREKTLLSIAKRNNERKDSGPAARPRKKAATKGSSSDSEESTGMNMVQPRETGDAPKKKRARKKAIRYAEKGDDAIVARQPLPKGSPKKKSTAKKAKSKKKEPDGSVNRLREERRDLFDLLYGDDKVSSPKESNPAPEELDLEFEFGFGDEDLDSYDPYGLEDY